MKNSPWSEVSQHYPQFINYRLELKDNGKLNKAPLTPVGDRSGFKTFTEAVAQAEILNKPGLAKYGTGFMLTADDPFFCIDIDSCVSPDGQWEPHALTMFQAFPGAFAELSVSGKGVHIWGMLIGDQWSTKYKNRWSHYEFYHNQRFIALGEPITTGNIFTDWSPALMSVLQERPATEQVDNATGAVPEYVDKWAGDDTALIEHMLQSSGTKAAQFGQEAHFRDLWTANRAKLAMFFPDTDRPGEYDASAADMALMNQLAYWTGKNATRMERIAKQSALVRPKWDRKDYLPRTIVDANNWQRSVYTGPKTPDRTIVADMVDDSGAMVRVSDDGTVTAVPGVVGPADMPAYFNGCVSVPSERSFFMPTKGRVDLHSFNAFMGGYEFYLGTKAGTKDKAEYTKNPSDVFSQLRERNWFTPAVADGYTFEPACDWGEIIPDADGSNRVNLYRPRVIPRKPCTDFGRQAISWMFNTMFHDHDRDILWAWMAALVQSPGFKFHWSPVIIGPEGTFKSHILKLMGWMVNGSDDTSSRSYVGSPGAGEFESQYNEYMRDKLLVYVEEMHMSSVRESRAVADMIKDVITGSEITINEKFGSKGSHRNHANFAFASNHDDAVAVDRGSRRYSILRQSVSTLAEWMNRVNSEWLWNTYIPWHNDQGRHEIYDFFMTYDVPHEFDPRSGARQAAPWGTQQSVAIDASMSPIAQAILDADAVMVKMGPYITSNAIKNALLQNDAGDIVVKMKGAAMRRVMKELGWTRMGQLTIGDRSVLYYTGNERDVTVLAANRGAVHQDIQSRLVSYYNSSTIRQ